MLHPADSSYTAGAILVRPVSSFQVIQFFVSCAAVSLSLDVVANCILIWLCGLAGIGRSPTLVYLVSAEYSYAVVQRLSQQHEVHG